MFSLLLFPKPGRNAAVIDWCESQIREGDDEIILPPNPAMGRICVKSIDQRFIETLAYLTVHKGHISDWSIIELP